MRTNILLLSILSLISANIFAGNTKSVSLQMSEPSTGLSNIAQVYFAPGTSLNYASPQDVKEVTGNEVQPYVYSLTADGVACSSLGYGDLNTSVVIAIGYQIQLAGTFIFSAIKGNELDPGSIIVLEDRTLGTFTNLMGHNDTVAIAQSGESQSRFYLHVSTPPVLTSIASGCSDTGGIIKGTQDTSIMWSSILLFDSSNVTIQQLHYVKGDFTFNNLAAGRYFVGFFTASGYLFVYPANVTGTGVQLTISSSATEIELGQSIQFFSVVSNSSLYSWTFGDSTIITGVANPTYNFIENGHYNVELHVTNNFQCTAVANISISVGEQPTATGVVNTPDAGMNVYSFDKNIVINNSGLDLTNNTYEIYNLAGQLIANAPVTSSHLVIGMDGQSAGYYVVLVKTENGSFTRKLFIG